MKTFLASIIVVLILFSGCNNQPAGPEIKQGEIFNVNKIDGMTAEAVIKNFVAALSGFQEVPPVMTLARGMAYFQLNFDVTELSYTLNVANIQNITQAHIHLAPPGENGPVVAWLYPSGPPPILIPGRFNGVLATGVITGDDLIGPLLGEPLDELIAAIKDGNAYVNVHTSQNPGGEIRGQIVFGNGMITITSE
jgi:hypothetical protein